MFETVQTTQLASAAPLATLPCDGVLWRPLIFCATLIVQPQCGGKCVAEPPGPGEECDKAGLLKLKRPKRINTRLLSGCFCWRDSSLVSLHHYYHDYYFCCRRRRNATSPCDCRSHLLRPREVPLTRPRNSILRTVIKPLDEKNQPPQSLTGWRAAAR